jgi:hypothetical protein
MGDEKVYQSPKYFYCVAYILFHRPFKTGKLQNVKVIIILKTTKE